MTRVVKTSAMTGNAILRFRSTPSVICMLMLLGLAGCHESRVVQMDSGDNLTNAGSGDVLGAIPDAKIVKTGDNGSVLYGTMSSGKTPNSAAENFRRRSLTAFGVSPDELVPTQAAQDSGANAFGVAKLSKTATGHASGEPEGLGLMYNRETGQYKFRLFNWQQQRDGIPVYGAQLRTLVRVGSDNEVVWASESLKPLGDFQLAKDAVTPTINKAFALDAARREAAEHGAPAPEVLVNFSTPEKIIFAGAEKQKQAPQLAMQYTAKASDGTGQWTFIADVATGAVLHIESTLRNAVTGTVTAEVMQGLDSMACDTLGISPMPYAKVSAGGVDYYADQNGHYTIPADAGETVTVSSTIEGRYFRFANANGTLSPLTVTAPGNGTADFLHLNNGLAFEDTQAQYLAYRAANEIRDFLLSYIPDYPLISTDHQMFISVNLPEGDPRCTMSGGGQYDGNGRSISLCAATDTVTNSAFASIVHHEYGHHVNSSGGAGYGPYDEGMADVLAMLYSKNPILGVGYNGDCSSYRRSADIDCVYQATGCSSCGDTNHSCGRLISSTIWDIWQNLDADNVPDSDDLIRSLVLSSIPMHVGGDIDASIAVDLLVLDDDDGVLENGTPNYDAICDAFNEHGMACPPREIGMVVKGAPFDVTGPGDGPFAPEQTSFTIHNLNPADSLSYAVNFVPDAPWLTVDAGSGSIAAGSAVTLNVSVDQNAAAGLADGKHTATIAFVNSTTGTTVETFDVSLWVDAPVPVFTATFDNDMEGFVFGDEVEIENAWHRSIACADIMPGHSVGGSLYMGRDDYCNYSVPYPGMQVINSPAIEIENPQDAILGLNYYLRTFLYTDSITGEVSAPFTHIKLSLDGENFDEVVASTNEGGVPLIQAPGWTSARYDLSEHLPTTGPVTIWLQFGMDPGGPYNNDKMGFVVDDVVVYARSDIQNGDVEIPARIEAEDYDRAWDSTAGNTGGACDTGDNVDKELTGDTAGGGCNVGWIAAGEWLEYDVSVATTGIFDITARLASDYSDRSIHVEIDGADVTGALTAPANGWQSYSDVTAENVTITAGDHVVRIFMNSDYLNINYIDFTLSGNGDPCGDNVCDSNTEDCYSCPADCSCTVGCTCPAGCDAVVNVGVPFTKDGVDNTCYFLDGSAGSYINSWNVQQANLNGTDISNIWIGAPNYPAQVDGGYYLYNNGVYPWSHVEVR